MVFNPKDIPSLITHLPQSVGDLVKHEDKALIESAAPLLLDAKPIAPPRGSPPKISIGKEADMGAGRDRQNMELLVHDWLHNLPDYDPEHEPVQRLIDHWQRVLKEQPKRLAEAQQAYWNTEEGKLFWHEMLKNHPHAMKVDAFHAIWQEWERAAGVHPTPLPPDLESMRQQQQWRDLVIRSRMHGLTTWLYQR